MNRQPPKEIRKALEILDRAILELQRSKDNLTQAWEETLQPLKEAKPGKERRGGFTTRPSGSHPWRNRQFNAPTHKDEETK